MVAALTRVFGVHNLTLAEDVVQDAFLRALEVWGFRGMPDNPSGWLMATAKNRALDVLRRERTAQKFAPELGHLLESEWTLAPALEELFAPNAIRDDQLRMMFSCCHAHLPEEAHVSLILHILCGFSVGEISAALMSSQGAIEKRLTRAKKVLAGSKKLFDVLPSAEFSERLPSVQRALYLLFNEGYHGASPEVTVRAELCYEAIRLAALLANHPAGATAGTMALSALMCLNAARLPGRVDASSNLISLFDQDRSKWDRRLMAEGFMLHEASAVGQDLTEYHLEAAIATEHAVSASMETTNWAAIVAHYDRLMRLRSSPVIALNRAIAVAQLDGPDKGLNEIQSIDNVQPFAHYPFYSAALGELEQRRGNYRPAADHFRAAAALARNPMERRFLQQRLALCEAQCASRSSR